ncbi:2-aminoethanethiol dioxygenase [Halotydeus destructor]|nr:2-aminoethanethiol dioxygenase [Halotydeus destructor]
MSSLIKQVASVAQQAFGRISDEKFWEHLTSLTRLAARLTAADLGLTKDTVKPSRSFFGQSPPSSYISVKESDDFTIGIFVIRNGQRIPLHDHPGMFGLVKVLLGTISIKSFTPLPNDGRSYRVPKEILSRLAPNQHSYLIPAKCHGTKEITSDTEEITLLTPDDGNFHYINSVNGDAAFLDILAPPYNRTSRDCTYYKEVGTAYDEANKMDITWLLEIPPPAEFWTDQLPYKGPSPN